MSADQQKDKGALLKTLKIERTAQHESRRTGSWLIVIIVLAVISLLALGLASRGEKEAEANHRPEVKKESSDSAPFASASERASERASESNPSSQIDDGGVTLNASGYITARRLATMSAQILGLITEVNVDEGMAVEEGQILARLDASVATVNLDLAQAQVRVLAARVSSLRADLDEARRVRKRIAGLSSANFASDAEITQAQSNVDKALSALAATKADIEVAKINVRQQQTLVDKHIIRAPFSGVVIGKNAQPGEIVSPSSAGGGFTRTGICTIVDMGSLEIEVDVNESFIGRVFSGQRVIANLDAYPKWEIPASVIAVIPAANRAKATVRVRIKLGLSDPRILPDMGVKVAFY